MNIAAISRFEVEQVVPRDGYYLISINEPNDSYPCLKDGWQAVLYLKFDDVEWKLTGKDGSIVTREFKLFDDDAASKILEFVNKNKEDINMLVIHCHAGISRSVGVKVALESIINKTDLRNRYPLHNKLVYKILVNQ